MRQEKENNRTDNELIKARKGNKEDKRQQLRKGAEKSSRLLDNYFNSKIHPHNWRPNGKVSSNSHFITYYDSNLNYNNDNSKGSSSNNNKEKSLKKQIHFLEFDYMEENDVIIIIEHCSKCNEHQSHTQHINNIYQSISKYLQKCILIRYPFIKVYLKPIDTQITDISKIKSSTDDSNKDVRIGALEIQMAIKLNNNVNITLLHSKLNTSLWPNISTILNRISHTVPLINIKSVLYDKEEGLNDDNKQIDDFLPSKFENVKVNLYQLYFEQIDTYTQCATDELNIILNPKRRQMAINGQLQQQQQQLGQLEEKNNYSMMTTYTNNTHSTLSRPTTSKVSRLSSGTVRPITGRSSYSQSRRSIMNSTMSNFHQGRPSSSSTSHYSTYSKRLNALETLDDPETISQMKGKLLSSGYTDNQGCLTFQNVPYDSYLIEIEASKHFLTSATVTRFNKIIQLISNNSDTNDIITINKYFGLRRQIDSYVEVYIYSNENNHNELDMTLINNAKVYLIRSYECDASLFPPEEDKLLLNESKDVKGRYELITSPGKIYLEIHKEGYESIKKEITLRTGENKINIELVNRNNA